jgi:hypothetical protein
VPDVFVPPARWPRWVANFENRHGEAMLRVSDGRLHGAAVNGAWFDAQLPFDGFHDGVATTEAFADAALIPPAWGVLLVRKGGFAIARLSGDQLVDSKVGRRHVQGKTKAGGQSQQRFARRRDKQAREAYEAAAGHAARILGGLGPVVTGGDRGAVAEVLSDPRLYRIVPVERWLAVPDPKRAVLDQAVLDACAIAVHVENG